MSDDRDRRAAEEWLRNWFIPGADIGQHVVLRNTLTALLAATRAEGAAEAIEAAARIADTEADNAATAARHVGGDDCWVKQQLCAEQAATAILHRIRALGAGGLVAMSVDDAETMIEVAECMIENATDQWRRDGWCRVIRAAIDRIRAALARKEE